LQIGHYVGISHLPGEGSGGAGDSSSWAWRGALRWLERATCYPFDFIGPAPLRFVVRAREVGRPGAALEPNS
jgi:hypothetical protein